MKYYVADFETVVEDIPELQTETEVWGFALTQMFDNTEDVIVGNDIEQLFKILSKTKDHKTVYYHNIKFDGSFILDYLTRYEGFEPALEDLTPDEQDKDLKKFKFKKADEIENKQLIYTITDDGIWYTVTVKYNGVLIDFKDSLKLLPYSVKQLAKDFDTKRKKLSIDYKGHKHKGELITTEEREYIANDVLVVKEALEKFITIMDYRKKPPLTIGQACMREFKKQFTKEEYDDYFPNLAEIKIDPSYGCEDADTYIRRSYMGGWCCVNETYSCRLNPGTKVLDVNSLYPFSMHSKSGNYYPIGLPTFFKGIEGLKQVQKHCYYFVRFKARFKLKRGCFPFIQLKYDENYRANENLITSSRDRYGNIDNNLYPEMTLSKTTFEMFIRCYEVKDLLILDGCWFYTEIGIFDSYINRFIEMKNEGAKQGNKALKQTGKLLCNNLYGKMGTSPENSFKVAIEKEEDEPLYYDTLKGENKAPVAVQVASACTSYARRYTLLGALNNREFWRYTDTDSCHFVKPENMSDEQWRNWKPEGMKIDNLELGSWKIESEAEHSIFIRSKTYMEFTEDKEDPSKSYYDIKCGGLPDRSKDLFRASLMGITPNAIGELTISDGKETKVYMLDKDEFEFCMKKRTYKDFKQGLSIPGKLLPKVIKGGTVLVNDCFTIK